MKKLIFILLLIPFNVYAHDDKYSEYKYTENHIESTDKIQVEEIKKCKYYKYQNIYTEDYYNFSYKDNEYINRSNDFIYSNEITSNEEPNIKEIKDLTKTEYSYYKEFNKINYLILNNFEYEINLGIKEITIYDKENNVINYQIVKGNKEFNDKNYSSYSYVKKEDVIILKLDKSVELEDIYINIIVTGRVFTNFSMNYNLNYSGKVDDIYNYGTLTGGLSSQNFYRITESDYKTNESLSDELKKVEGKKEEINNAKIIKYETIYKYKEKLYKYYKIDKIYLGDYYTEKEGYLRDDDNCKTIYKYRILLKEQKDKEENIKVYENNEIKIPEMPKQNILKKEINKINENNIVKKSENQESKQEEIMKPVNSEKNNVDDTKEIKTKEKKDQKSFFNFKILFLFISIIFIIKYIYRKKSKKYKF